MTESLAQEKNHALPKLRVVAQRFTLGHTVTGHLLGLRAEMVQVEVACRRGPSVFSLSGLAEAAVREARIRVKSALEYRGIHLDEFALTVSLAPADLKKTGSGFDLPLAPGGTEFQNAVWAQLARIPFGELRSYGDIAREMGRPKAMRAVGAANGRNPIPIVVPCHRVIGSDGSLTGFAGGLDAKKTLLNLEGALD